MNYSCASCGSCNYHVSGPEPMRYIPSDDGISYSVIGSLPVGYASLTETEVQAYSASLPMIAGAGRDTGKKMLQVNEIPMQDVEIIPPKRSGISNLEEIPRKEFFDNPGLKQLLPRDEIERAIERMRQDVHIEIEEQVVIRRRIRLDFHKEFSMK